MNDIETILLGDQQWMFLLECALRAIVMVIIVMLLFKITGKKEVRQFSILELIVLIGLGSALGDPMFYEDVGVLPAAVAITMVLVMYKLMNYWTNHSRKAGEWVSGKVVTVFANGIIDRNALLKEGWSIDEFFGDLRVAHVEHLGQVKAAHVEVDGELSIFYHPDDEVNFGLPISPDLLQRTMTADRSPHGPVSCGNCGLTEMSSTGITLCRNCSHDHWLPSIDTARIA